MRVTTKGQVTIPKDIRDYLGIEPGSEVDFVKEGTVVRLVPNKDEPSFEARMLRFEESLARMSGTLDLGGLGTDEYIDMIRGPREDLDIG